MMILPVTPLDVGISLIMLAIVASVASSPDQLTSLLAFLPWTGIVTSYYAAYGRRWVEPVCVMIWQLLAISAAAAALIHQPERVTGLVGSPNTLAVLLNMTMPVAAHRVNRRAGYMVVAATAILVLLTRSRSGLIGLVLAIAVMYRLPVRRWLWLAAAAAVAMPLLRPDTTDILANGKANRTAFWGIALDMWQQSPWVGAGLGTYGHYYEQAQDGWVYTSAHNLLMQTAAEMGGAGLVAMLITVCLFGLHIAKRGAKYHLLASLAAFGWHCQLDTPEPIVMAVAAAITAAAIDQPDP